MRRGGLQSISPSCRRYRGIEQAINCDDGDRAGKMIRDALGIESDEVINYCFPTQWPANREQRAKIIAEWLQTEARLLGERYGS
jgi:uncharacterized protein HemY